MSLRCSSGWRRRALPVWRCAAMSACSTSAAATARITRRDRRAPAARHGARRRRVARDDRLRGAHVPAGAHPNLAFRVADAARLPFADEFDLVVSFNCLHWVRDQAAALRGIRAALAPVGAHAPAHAWRAASAGRSKRSSTRRAARRSGRATSSDTSPRTCTSRRTSTARSPSSTACASSGWTCSRRPGTSTRATRSCDFAEATFVEWTRMIPADRHRRVHRRRARPLRPDGNVFTFYQMEVALRRVH